MHPAIAVALSYVSGSVPAAWLAGKAYGVDLRKQGSGNLGATNVLRVLGPKVGAAVLVVDMAKGAVPALLFPRLVPLAAFPAAWGTNPRLWLAIVCGVAAIVGHARPVFLGFSKGGKGVATAGGVFLGLAPVPTAAALVAFAAVVLISGYVSLASLTAAAVLPLAMYGWGAPDGLVGVSIAIAVFVFWTHRNNIGRLRRGEEHRFGKHTGSAAAGLGVAVVVGLAVVIGVALTARVI